MGSGLFSSVLFWRGDFLAIGLSNFLSSDWGRYWLTEGDNGHFLPSLRCIFGLEEWSTSFLPLGVVLSGPSFKQVPAFRAVLVVKAVSSTVMFEYFALLSPDMDIGLNAASETEFSVYGGEGGNTSSSSKLKMSSISTENTDRGEGKSKSEISDGVERFECESECFSVVSDEQDVVDPCLISSHSLWSSSAF